MGSVAVVAVVAIAGVMSGLTLGLLSMDRLDLELMMRTGSKKQERLARRYVHLLLALYSRSCTAAAELWVADCSKPVQAHMQWAQSCCFRGGVL